MILRLLVLSVLISLGLRGAQEDAGTTPQKTARQQAVQLGTIVDSKHDFSRYGWSGDQICLPCHTPHGAQAPQLAPLWDRAPAARERYTLYDGSRGLPGPASLVCLSCHDGSTAVDSYGGMSGEVFMAGINGGRSLIGSEGDLRRNHPIGVRYPAFDRGYNPRIQVEADGFVTLPQGRVECLSCHDVHNQISAEHLLAKSNRRSALCLTCHRK